jgi:hypothetical protein
MARSTMPRLTPELSCTHRARRPSSRWSVTMRHIAIPAALAWAVIACSDRPGPTELDSPAPTSVTATARGGPTEVDETPFTVPFCGFPIEVVLSGKGKTIELPAGRTIITSPGLTATLTNLDNGNQATLNITGSLHQRILDNGNVEIVSTGRSALFAPVVSGLVLVIGRWSYVLDSQGNLVQSLQGNGQLIDVCELLA